jgi:hypothetical protein
MKRDGNKIVESIVHDSSISPALEEKIWAMIPSVADHTARSRWSLPPPSAALATGGGGDSGASAPV